MTSGTSFLRHFALMPAVCVPTSNEIVAPTLSSSSVISYLSCFVVPLSNIMPTSVGIATLPSPANASPAGIEPRIVTTSFTPVG